MQPRLILRAGRNARLVRNAPLRLVSMVRDHCDGASASETPPRSRTPALLTRIPHTPSRACTSVATCVIAASSVTSATKVCTLVPCCRMACAAPSSPCASTSISATLAPARANCAAVACPIPPAAPVTTATVAPPKPGISIISAMVDRSSAFGASRHARCLDMNCNDVASARAAASATRCAPPGRANP